MTGITDLVAAELSQAAYTPIGDYQGSPPLLTSTEYLDSNGDAQPLPSGWSVDLSHSGFAGGTVSAPQDQFLVFVSSAAKQVVIAFKGSDNLTNFANDLTNDGYQDWNALQATLNTAYNGTLVGGVMTGGILQAYPTTGSTPWTIMTDGHSLGGGMAQTFAALEGLNGYGQNSLPIAQETINNTTNDAGLGADISSYASDHYTFAETNTSGDPATAFYSKEVALGEGRYLYTPSTTETLGNPYAAGEIAGASIAQDILWSISQSSAVMAAEAINAHLIGSVISAIQASEPVVTITPTENDAIIAAYTSGTYTANSDGSATITEPYQSSDAQYKVSLGGTTPIWNLSSLNLTAGEAYVYDLTTGESFTATPSNLYTTAAAVVLNDSDGSGITFEQGNKGAGTLTLSDGATIDVGGAADLSLSNIDGGSDTDLQALLNYLSASGDSLTAAQLQTLDYNALNPTGTGYTVTGTPDYTGNVNFNVSNVPGAIITGPTTTEAYVNGVLTQVPAYNILDPSSGASVDLTQDSISNIQELDLQGGDVALSGTEFGSFGTIAGDAVLTMTSAGNYSLNTSQVTADIKNFEAQNWGGTTLTGNTTTGQTLTASLFGNDTLNAGNGTGDYLVAGDGVDTLNGGTGGDTFEALNGLAAGSVINGQGTGNTLDASGNISSATISGVQTLSLDGVVDLTNSQFNEFSSITGDSSNNSAIVATTGGTYSFTDNNTTGTYLTFYTDATDNTTLIGDASSGQYLTLSAAGSTGTDTLKATGNGVGMMIAGEGVDTLIGAGEFEALNGLAVGSVIQGTGSSSLDANGDISQATITGVSYLNLYPSLDVTGYSADVTLTSAQMAQLNSEYTNGGNDVITASGGGTYQLNAQARDGGTLTVYTDATDNTTLSTGALLGFSNSNLTLSAAGSTGTDTLSMSNGTGTLVAGYGVDTLVGGNDTFVLGDHVATGTEISTGGTGGILETDNTADISGLYIGGDGISSLDDNSSSMKLTATQLGAFTTMDNILGTSPASLVLTENGTYNLSSDTVTGAFAFDFSQTTGAVTLTGSNANDQTLTGGTGTDTLTTGTGTGDTVNSNGTGDTVNLNSANGTATIDGTAWTNANASGDTVNDNGAGDTDVSNASGQTINSNGNNQTVDLYGTGSAATISGSQTWSFMQGNGNTLTSTSASSGENITASGMNENLTIGGSNGVVTTSNTGDTVNITGAGNWVNLNGDSNTLTLSDTGVGGSSIIVNGNSEAVTASGNDNGDSVSLSGNSDNLTVNGSNLWINVNAGSTNGDIAFVGTATGNSIHVNGDNASFAFSDTGVNDNNVYVVSGNSDSITANGNDDGDGINFSGNNESLTANGSSLWINVNGGSTSDDIAFAGTATGNSVHADGDNTSFTFSDTGTNDNNVYVGGNSNSIVADGNDNGDSINLSGTSDSLTINGNNLWVNVNGSGGTITDPGTQNTINLNGASDTASGGDDWYNIAGGVSAQIGGGENSTYQFGSTFGTDVINNLANGTATTANGSVGFGSGVTDEDLWFKQSGSNLVVDLLGTTDTITIDNWFGSNAGAEVQNFTANGLKLDTQLASLVSAMATFSANNPGFNPATATGMPTDTTLQNAIAAAWHT